MVIPLPSRKLTESLRPGAAPFHFEHQEEFTPERAAKIFAAIPALPGVFALYGPLGADGQPAQPYLTRAADLRRRIKRILAPPEPSAAAVEPSAAAVEPSAIAVEPSADSTPILSKRLNLRQRVARIEYTVTGSEFESTLSLYHASAAIFGLDQARRRLHLRTPFFLRFTTENAYPRVYTTNRLSKRSLEDLYGPFPSRAAADRYLDAVLDLFKLRRCYEELAPYPEHPGCVYGEMKKCLAPCNQACTPEGAAAYSAEAAAVKRFFDTRGESLIISIGLEREEASNALDFERAAALHERWHKVKAAQSLADELVQPIPNLSAIIIQPASKPKSGPNSGPNSGPKSGPASGLGAPRPDSETWVQESIPEAAVFLLHSGCLAGPARLSTLGVRAVKEQTSVGSSLFAQPLMLEAIPLSDDPQPTSELSTESTTQSPTEPCTELGAPCLASETWADATQADSTQPAATQPAATQPDAAQPDATKPATPSLSPELRAATLIAALETQASTPTDLGTLSDHLSLVRRWFYRPEKQRAGEIFFPKAESSSLNINHEWPIRRILNAAARAALGDPQAMADTQRDLATHNPAEPGLQPTRTKTLHAGRPDVEREVPVIDKQPPFKSRRNLR